MFRKLKNFISEPDQFLKAYDVKHPELTASQQQEVDKHDRIFQQRDHAQEKDSTYIWEDF